MRYGRLLKHQRHRRWRFVAVPLIVAIGIAAVYVDRTLAPQCTEVKGQQTVNLPLAELGRGTARTFCYRDSSGEVIRFIIARDSDGTIHSAFDACRGCFEYDQGYRLTGAEMVCRFCGLRYPLKEMGSGIASCVPLRLPHLTLSDGVQIKVADLEAGRWLFQNKDN
jgi:uncharacterized membrane protein